jgi:ubiquinone/menaquinone biosynthesis C-methylase UbiE
MNAKKISGFDTIAPVYDALATIVFGRAIRNAELYYLSEVRHGGKVLIVGGGTGRLLVDLLRVNPYCEIWYVDASEAMVRIARSNINKLSKARVHFIHGVQDELPSHVQFDTVIANFYFDLFSAASLDRSLKHIHTSMLPDGKVLVSDFTNNNLWWQSALLSLMYLFFKWSCRIEATTLPDWQRQLLEHNFTLKTSRGFYGNFIRSAVYENKRLANRR